MSTADDVTSNLLTAAHEYRSRSWRVIQLHKVGPDGKTCSCKKGANCTSAGKHPIDTNWQSAAPMSGADIEEAWTGWKAKANLGLATGSESGFWVLDLDPKDNGVEEFRKVLDGRTLPQTYTVQTGSGGYHYYFAMPEGVEIRNTQGKIAPGVDTRATGGQVVAAPSRTDKGVYTVLRDCAPSPAPEWLLGLVRKQATPAEVLTAEDLPRPEDIPAAEWDRLNKYARRVIDSELERLARLKTTGWQGEPWDATTFQASCSLIEIANSPWNSYSLGQAEADVLKHAPRDTEGFDDWKVKQKFSSAREKVGDKVRPMPEQRKADPAADLFAGPDVRQQDPTRGGGETATPVADDHGPERFFGEKGALQIVTLGQAITDLGPLGFGGDEDWWEYRDGVWVQDRKVVRRRTSRLLGQKAKRQYANEAAEHLEFSDATFNIDGFPHERFMNFRNTMLDWRTGEEVGHDPNFKSTVQFPINWNPEATCPTFEKFLSEVMHQDYIDLAWEMIGYLMLSGNPLQVAFLLYGTGGNGKGTLTRVIQDILGDENVANEPLDRLNADRFSSVNLFGKIANIAGDIDATYQESTANFKRLTGEDKVAAERKFGDRFVFESWAVPLFSANKIPGSSDVTEGYLRRWVVLHFHKTITNPIPGLSTLLAAEVEGVAAKAIPALRTLMEREKFDPKGEAVKAKEEFARTIDQVRQWVASPEEVQQAPDHWEPLSRLYVEYTAWAARTNRGRINEQEFSHRLEAIGHKREVVAGTTCHLGVRPRDRQQSPTTSTFF